MATPCILALEAPFRSVIASIPQEELHQGTPSCFERNRLQF